MPYATGLADTPRAVDLNGVAAGFGALTWDETGFSPSDLIAYVTLSIVNAAGSGVLVLAITATPAPAGAFTRSSDGTSIVASWNLTAAQVALIAAAGECRYAITPSVIRSTIDISRERQVGRMQADTALPPAAGIIASVLVAGGPVIGSAGVTAALTASAFDAFGTPVATAFVWASSNPAAATVDATGHVTLVAQGSAIISATAMTITGTTGATTTAAVALGDLLVGNAGGSFDLLAPTTNAYVLTLVAGVPVWAPSSGGGGGGQTLTFGANLTGGSYNGSAPVTIAVSSTPSFTSLSTGSLSVTSGVSALQAVTATTGHFTGTLQADGAITGSLVHALTPGTHLTGTSYNNSGAVTLATDATSAASASTIVARDGTGAIQLGTVTPPAFGGSGVGLAIANNGSAQVQLSAFGSAVAPILVATRAQGTQAAPTASLSGDILIRMVGGGYTGSGYLFTPAITAAATENWAPGAGGSKWSFQVVNTGTATASTMTFGADGLGGLVVPGTVTAPTFIGALTGNASTATKWATARNVNGVALDGTADITVPAAASTLTGATLAANVLASSLTSTGTLSSLTVSGLSALQAVTATTGHLTGTLQVDGTITGSLANTLTFGTHLTGASYNNSGAVTLATDAVSTSTVSTLVARDTNGVSFFGNAAMPGIGARTYTGVGGAYTGFDANHQPAFRLVSYGSSARYVVVTSGGSAGAPTASASGAGLGVYSAGGYDSVGFVESMQITALATENWSSTAHGTSLSLQVTPNGTTSLQTAVLIGNDSSVTLSNGLTVSAGTTVLQGATVTSITSTGLAAVALGSITTNQQALSLSSTYNNGATVFDGALKIAVTDTAHGSGSNLVTVLGGSAGTSPKLALDVFGTLTLSGGITASSSVSVSASGTFIGLTSSSGLTVSSGTAALQAITGTSLTLTGSFSGRIAPRVNNTTSSATPAINTDTTDQFEVTALAVNITGVTYSGTPTEGQPLTIAITDNGTPRTLPSPLGAGFQAGGQGIAFPTTTVAGARLYMRFLYNSTAVKFDLVGVA